MTKTTTILIGVIFGLSVLCVTLLSGLGRDTAQLISFLGVLIPTTVSLVAVNKADKAASSANVAAEASQQTAHQTNGRMTELIQTIQQLGGTVPDGYEDLTGGTSNA